MTPRTATPRVGTPRVDGQTLDVIELASQLRLAVARLTRRIRQEAAATGEELTTSTQSALASIERLGPITLGELAAAEQVQPPSMTRIVARLEEWGYATRVVDPADRRVARAAITDEGRVLLARSRTLRDAYLARRMAEFTDSERVLLARALPLLERLQDDAPLKSLRGTFQSMHVRNFRLFFTGQLISQGGTWMQTIALNWLVLHLSHNNGFLVGLAIALQFLPTLLFGVWGGAIADRFDKRRVLLCTQVAMAVVAVLLTIVDVAGVDQLWVLYVLIFAYGMALAIDNPTRQSFVSELVPPADLPNAIGLSSAIFQLARVLGPALAGVLILAGGTSICFGLNAVSFVFVIIVLLMMRTEELHRSKPLGREKGQLKEGLNYIWQTAELRWILLLMLVVGTFAINSPVVLPLLAKITFHSGPEVYSWMSIAMGAGAMFGALFAANRFDTHGRVLVSTGMAFGVGICVASLAPSLELFIAMLVVVGAGQIAFLSITNSSLQLMANPTMRGRVMAVYTITLLGTTPIGGPLIGWISDQFGPRWGFAVGGIATILGVLVFGTVFVRARRVANDDAMDAAGMVRGIDGEAIPASVS